MSSCTAFEITPIQDWVENYFRERRLRAVAHQQEDRLRSLMERLRELLPHAEQAELALEHTLQRAAAREKAGNAGGAVELLDAAITDLQRQVMILQEQLEQRIADLQRRFHALPARANAARLGADRLEIFVRTALPPDWSIAERERLLARAQAAQQRFAGPPVPAADLSTEGVRNLEAAEAQLAAVELALATEQRDLENEIAATHKRLLSEHLGRAQQHTVTLAEFFALNPRPVAAPGSATEDRTAAKLASLLAKIGALQDTAGWADLMRRADLVRVEVNPSHRRSLYEDLVLEASRRLTELRVVDQWLLGVDELLADAAPFAGTAVDAIAVELRELRRAGRIADLAPWRTRLAEAQAGERARMVREHKRQAVLESLVELGYEPHEGLGTALVQAGKLVFRKAGESNYGVEIVTNRDLSMLQTEVIRFGDATAATAQEQLRDQEQEVKWCSEHDTLRDKLAKRGLVSSMKLQIPAGTKAVRVVPRASFPPSAPTIARPQQHQAKPPA